MPPSDIDDMLRDFLETQAQERSRGISLETLQSTLKTVVDRQGEHEKKDEQRHEEVMGWRISQERRTVALEKDVEHLKGDVQRVEDTGSHDMPEIIRAARGNGNGHERKSGGVLAKTLESSAGKLASKVIPVVVAAALGWLAHHVAWVNPTPPAAAAQHSP